MKERHNFELILIFIFIIVTSITGIMWLCIGVGVLFKYPAMIFAIGSLALGILCIVGVQTGIKEILFILKNREKK